MGADVENSFQRIGSKSNAHVGSAFEEVVRLSFATQGIILSRNFAVQVGASGHKKSRKFDLGSASPPILVECKSHRWTTGGNIPSAKITVWNEAMYYFHVAPKEYRKLLVVSKDFSASRKATLAAYYVQTCGHLIPDDVEIWEFDEIASALVPIHPAIQVGTPNSLPLGMNGSSE